MRLDNFLMRSLRDVPRSHIYRIIRSGEVRVNRGRARPATRLNDGDDVRIPPVRVPERSDPGRPPDRLMQVAVASIVEETEDLLLLNKPAGLSVHAGTGIRFGLVELLRAARDEPRLELIHRLDRDTSGCLLLARNRRALNDWRAAWRDHAVDKAYLALLIGVWRGGERVVDAPLVRDREQGGERMSAVDAAGRSAHSRFVPQQHFADATLAAVYIRTGRTHQIRVHGAHIGHPVAGDDKYGDRPANRVLRAAGLPRLCLHAWQLQRPDTGHAWTLPPPEDLAAFLQQLSARDDAS